MGFSGGGSSTPETLAHTHNAALANDGGQLSETLTDMNGVTLYSLITSTTAKVDPDQVVMDYSTTIGDYTQPTGATCSNPGVASPTYDNATFGAWTRGSSTQVSETGNIISFDLQTRTVNQTISTDLGATLSNSAWLLRGKLIYTALNSSPGNSLVYGEFGMGSANNATAIDNSGIGLDFIGLQQRIETGVNAWGLVGYNNSGGLDNPENPVMDSAPTTITYYIEIIRLSTTSMSIGLYSDAAFTTLIMPIETKVISSGITALQYLRIGNGTSASGTDGNQVQGTIEDLQIWDNTTTTASSCANAVDDNLATLWESSAAANNWIYVDVGSEKDLSQMTIYPNAATTETQYKIQYSNDLVTWTDLRLINVSALTNAAYNYIRFNTVTARYVRIYGNSGSVYVMAINEIKVDETNAVSTEHGHLEIDPTDATLPLDGIVV